MRRISSLIALLAVAALGAGPAGAADFKFGLNAGGALPMVDLKDFNDSTYGVIGGFMQIHLGGGHVIRPRVEGIFAKETSDTYSTSKVFKKNVSGLNVTADYAYYFEGRPEGFYISGGVGLMGYTAKIAWDAYENKESSSNAGITVGVGYDLPMGLGFDVRYGMSKFKVNHPKVAYDGDPKAAAVYATVSWKF